MNTNKEPAAAWQTRVPQPSGLKPQVLTLICGKAILSCCLCLKRIPESDILPLIAVTDTLQKALQQVRARKALKIRQRDQLNAEIAQLDATEIGIQNALGQRFQAEIAWTDLVRTVLNQVPGAWMSAVEVRDTLLGWGYTFVGIANPLAFINNILNRLTIQGEIERSDSGRPFRFMTNPAKEY